LGYDIGRSRFEVFKVNMFNITRPRVMYICPIVHNEAMGEIRTTIKYMYNTVTFVSYYFEVFEEEFFK
jgi:hypothetical protein